MSVGLIHRHAPATYAEYERVASALESPREPHQVFRLPTWVVHVLVSWSSEQSSLPDGYSYRALLLFFFPCSRISADQQNLTTTGCAYLQAD